MGTNFYMMTKDKSLAERYFPNEYELVDDPYFGYEIHIGKRSSGWKPLLEGHRNAYKSVDEMKSFIDFHKTDIEIFDEYRKKYSLEELQEELLDWEEMQRVRYMKYIPDGVIVNEKYGWKDYFIESTKDDYDITMPYDHVEYSKFNVHERWCPPNYWNDKDGYNFVDGSFS